MNPALQNIGNGPGRALTKLTEAPSPNLLSVLSVTPEAYLQESDRMNPARSHEYTLLIPSRRRVENAAATLALLPGAKVYVDERESDEYARAVGIGNVVTHSPARGIAEVRTMAIRSCPTFWLVMVDDDFKGVISQVGRRPRRITEPAAIQRIIENQLTACNDLELSMFCWNRSAHPGRFQSHSPFNLCAPGAGAFGIGGKCCMPDPRLVAYEDVDLSMQSLLRHRVILCDNRYYFDFGRCWQGKGGNQGIRTSDSDEADRAVLLRRWGRYLDVSAGDTKNKSGFKKANVFGMSIKVRRKSLVTSTK